VAEGLRDVDADGPTVEAACGMGWAKDGAGLKLGLEVMPI